MAKRPLTLKQQLFVRKYIELGGHGHGKEAAIAAGYSPKTADSQAAQILAKPAVRAALEAKVNRIEARSELKAARVIEELKYGAFLDPRDIFDTTGNLRPVHEMPEGARRALAALDFGKDGQVKLKFCNKVEALKLLGQHLKLFTEVHEHRGSLLDLLTGGEDAA